MEGGPAGSTPLGDSLHSLVLYPSTGKAGQGPKEVALLVVRMGAQALVPVSKAVVWQQVISCLEVHRRALALALA